MTSRPELERRVDELAAAHSGPVFADAIRRFFESLPEPERAELQQILVERSVSFDQAVMDRVDARGWFRRQWDKASPTER